ncbi:MAG TPA: hypothetical protein VFA70_09510 [Dehalococcoidia bacterium]|nr:hypothetical protein [Dehalococcoidia bacterium]
MGREAAAGRTTVVLFEYKLREGIDLDAYHTLNDHLYEVVRGDAAYGFLGEESIDREDGSRLVLLRFRDMDGVRRWGANPEHRAAQRRGRDEFYAWYRVSEGAVSEVSALHPAGSAGRSS